MFATIEQTTQAYLVPVHPEHLGSKSRQLRHVVGAALERGERRIVMDCSAWNNSDDVVMFSTLIGCAQLCADSGVAFELINLGGSVYETLRALRLTPRLGLGE
jgi:hypothetical protein